MSAAADHSALTESDRLMATIDTINQTSCSKIWFAGQRLFEG